MLLAKAVKGGEEKSGEDGGSERTEQRLNSHTESVTTYDRAEFIGCLFRNEQIGIATYRSLLPKEVASCFEA